MTCAYQLVPCDILKPSVNSWLPFGLDKSRVLTGTLVLYCSRRCAAQAAENEKKSLGEELERVRLKSQRAGLEVDKLQKKVDDLQHFSELERQVLLLYKLLAFFAASTHSTAQVPLMMLLVDVGLLHDAAKRRLISTKAQCKGC